MAQPQNSDFHPHDALFFSLGLQFTVKWSNTAYAKPNLSPAPYLPFHTASRIHKIVILIWLFNSFHSFFTSNCALPECFSKPPAVLPVGGTYPCDSSHIVSLYCLDWEGAEGTQAMVSLPLGCDPLRAGTFASRVLGIFQRGLTGGKEGKVIFDH